ncbi:MAG: hypothetical protein VXW22_08015 [Pseudomonadota bacterium]|nr:hypothetical protein [Pseudomonadota bacterium]
MSGLLILGMHRSGTSCLAGCLQAAGLHLGDVNTYAHFNQRGNREHEPIRDLHEQVLAKHGYAWSNPPSHQLEFSGADLDDLRQHVDELQKQAYWGIKDPRTVFFAEAWNTQFDCRAVGTYRHPLEVAESLESRAKKWNQDMSRADALALWNTYNRELLRLRSRRPFMLIRYGMSVEQYTDQISALAQQLGLDATRAVSFYSQELTHQNSADRDVPECCVETWEQLQSAWRETCEDLGAHRALSAMANESNLKHGADRLNAGSHG